MRFPATLGDLLRAPARESLRFVVLDEGGVCQGEALLDFRSAFTTQEGVEVPFRIPVSCARAVWREEWLEGVLTYQNLPAFAQMVGGLCVDGQIEGGWWLIEGLPYPRSLLQPPPVWRDPVELGSELGTGNESPMQDEEADFDIHARQLEEALEQLPLPQPWEHRRERGGGAELHYGDDWSTCGRMYFVDPRSRRTTWKDPRFLPQYWEQRIDPQTGRVYFQYHKTRQTTYADPRGCPPGWDMRLSKNGDIYFAYGPTKQSTFVDPRGLPEHLEAALDGHGRMFFKDHQAKTTTWQDPRDGQTEEVLAEWRREESLRWWRDQVWAAIEELARHRGELDDSNSQRMDLSR